VISADIRKQYLPTIGIECHVQLKTMTKLFSAVDNDAREAAPNTLISHIDLGMPGALPVLNEKAVELGIRAAFALGTEPQTFSKFDRKHYFYPDLPMGYQITQFYDPIIKGGSVKISVGGEEKTVRIHEAHLEADAGKSTHPAGKDYSLVDLNRAGTPLLEIVSEPDMHTSEEARIYARELYLRMKYAGVSDANLYYGNMRFDVNVSVSKDSDVLGTRTETKNLNSFRSVEKAIEFEIDRQIELLEKGEKITQETRGWDDAKQKTFSQRSKEEAHDYRYMPDPDIPPIELTETMIKPIRESMPIMPGEWRQQLKELKIDDSQIETLLEAEADDDHVGYLDIIKRAIDKPEQVKFLANFLVNVEIPLRRDGKTASDLSTDQRSEILGQIFELQTANKLSSTNARALYTVILTSGAKPDNIPKYAEEQGLIQVSNENEIAEIVAAVLTENSQAADDVKNGEMKAIGFLVGQVMQRSAGRANPQLAQQMIRKQLGL
jgi:aspartyl-tRNA(Asn)/glutamyl-tRNA(Gln) amidotransferase subunit B